MCSPLWAQSLGTVEGVVTLPTDAPIHRASVLLTPLGRIAETDANGRFRFENVPPGNYELAAFRWMLAAEAPGIAITGGETLQVNMRLGPALVAMEMKVGEYGRRAALAGPVPESPEPSVPSAPQESALAPVSVLDASLIPDAVSPTLGDVLDSRLGFARRSFGTGNARPIVRGLDSDRVLILEDGLRVGSLASQSGDHVEPVDASSLDRLEFVKGPSTLLYGSNAIGRAINAISNNLDARTEAGQGLRGRVSSAVGTVGTGSAYAGGGVNLEYGARNWRLWLGGSSRRAGDYDSPLGPVDNSRNRITNGSAGFGWSDRSTYLGVDYKAAEGRYGIPFADVFRQPDDPSAANLEAVDVRFRRNNIRLFGGVRDLGSAVEGFEFTMNYGYWNHDEVEAFTDSVSAVANRFENRELTYRGVFDQLRRGRVDGRFGFSASNREYRPSGEQALAPPVRRNAFAVFGVEELDLDPFQLEEGGRLDFAGDALRGVIVRRLSPEGDEEEAPQPAGFETAFIPHQSFTGGSAGIGGRYEVWNGGTIRVDLTSSFRAPALEELYSFGPHAGGLTFDIGDSSLGRERSNGIDVSFRHRRNTFRAGVDVFYYGLDDYVFFAPNPRFQEGLLEAEYFQGDARFRGMELAMDFAVRPSLWLNMGMEMVQSKLKAIGTPPPRIPPLRATFGLDYHLNRLRIRPQIVVADARNDVYSGENPTPGYGLVNLAASYTIPREHSSHRLAFNLFNAGNRLYRNHASLIKNLVPEMGRAIRFSYALEFVRSPRSRVSFFDPTPNQTDPGRKSGPDR